MVLNNEINSIEAKGFTKVKYYDTDLNYTYYDALLNGSKVEVRVSKEMLEWRYLGVSLEEVEWFSLKPVEPEVVENIEVEEKEEVPIASVIQKNKVINHPRIDILVKVHKKESKEQLALNL